MAQILEHANVLGTNGGVVEITFSSSEGTGVVYAETATGTVLLRQLTM